jgi:hypothetical protein
VVVDDSADDNEQKDCSDRRTPYNQGTTVLGGPFEAVMGAIDELVVL